MYGFNDPKSKFGPGATSGASQQQKSPVMTTYPKPANSGMVGSDYSVAVVLPAVVGHLQLHRRQRPRQRLNPVQRLLLVSRFGVVWWATTTTAAQGRRGS